VPVVTGISQNTNTQPIEQALRAASLSIDPLSVFTSGDAPDDRADSGIRFIYSGSDTPKTIFGQTSELTSFGGTEVPGLGLSEKSEYFTPESVTDELSETGIPDSALDNYVDAIEAGKSIITYQALAADQGRVEQIFRDAGLANVRSYDT
jgi:hypothetical protein